MSGDGTEPRPDFRILVVGPSLAIAGVLILGGAIDAPRLLGVLAIIGGVAAAGFAWSIYRRR